MDVKDKVVLVTGASAGIGLEVARMLGKNGAILALNARSKDKLDQLVIDILINNAGRGMHSPLESIDIKEYRELIELNIVGPLVAMQSIIPFMRQQGGGTIVNISSGTTLMYAPGLSGYSATKRALNGLTLTARNKLAKDKITVSLVYPYVTKSDFYKNMVTSQPKSETADDYVAGRAPADTSEFVAQLILDVIKTGEPEIFAHDWMQKAIK
jgi:short-subunit dehydrogenase